MKNDKMRRYLIQKGFVQVAPSFFRGGTTDIDLSDKGYWNAESSDHCRNGKGYQELVKRLPSSWR